MRTKRKSRLLSLGLCLCMLLGILPMSGMIYAAETPCPNHPAHTAECGYAEAVEGAPCKHIEAGEHDENCGYTAGTLEAACDLGCTELGEDGQTVHAEGCAYAPAVPGTPCKHEQGEHDEACGYIEAVEGQPCAHACELCAPADSGPAPACTCDVPCTGDAMNADCPVCGAEGALPEGCGFTACAKAEGCTLPDGHEGDCVPAMALGAPAPANSDLITGDGYTFEPGAGKLTVTSNAGTTGWRTDTNIAAESLARYKAVKSVELQGGVTEIGNWAFQHCTNLPSVNFPDGLTTIGTSAFHNCAALTTVNFPTGLQTIGTAAFRHCTGLTSVDLPSGLQTIGDWPFAECTSLTAINVATENAGFTSGDGVLYNKDKTTLLQYPAGKTEPTIIIPQSVIDIKWGAFYGCTSLTSVHLPSGLQAVRQYAFSDCSNLAELTFRSDAPPNIGEDAFSDIASSGTINFPSGKSAAYTEDWKNDTLKLTGWTLVELAEPGLINGDGYTFEPDTGKLTVTSNAGTTNWREDTNIAAEALARYQAVKSVELQDGVTEIGDMAFAASSLTAITLPEGITVIGGYAFGECPALTSIALPKSLTSISIAGGAFLGSYALSEINVAEGSKHFASEDGVLYNKDKTTLLQYPAGKTGDSFTVPDSVTAIGDYAFYGCSILTSVALPASLTNIGEYAFNGCTALASVKLPTGLTTIGYRAFAACDSLTSVDFPASLETIGDSAFLYSTGLTSLTFRSDAPPNIGEYAFSDIASSGTINFPSGKSAAYTEDWKNNTLGLTGWTLEEQNAPVITGDGYTFDPSTGKLTVTSNAGTTDWRTDTNIAADDMARYKAVKSVELQSGVTEIGDSAFERCSDLTSVNLPASLTTIGYRAFLRCTGLTSVGLPTDLTTIGRYAFSGCYSLTSVDLPTGLTTIEAYAFQACTGLTSVDFPASLTTVGGYAFYGCTRLASLTFRSDAPPNIKGGAFGNVANSGTINFPSGKSAAYTEDWKNNTLELTGWTLEEQSAPVITGDGYTFDPSTGKLTISTNDATFDYRWNNAINYETDVISVVVEDTVTDIKSAAFQNCKALKSATLPDGITNIKSRTFVFCTNLEQIRLPSSVTSIGEYAFYDNKKLALTNLPRDLETIENYAFQYCADLALTELPSKVTSIGYMAFSGCKNLALTALPDGVTSIKYQTFEDCINLKQMAFPPDLTIIGSSAFADCTGLTFLEFSDKSALTTISNSAFFGCKSLASLDLSGCSNLNSIGDWTFNKCAALTSLNLPASLQTIGQGAFNECCNLRSLTFEGDAPPQSINTNAFNGIAGTGDIFYPFGAGGSYTEAWRDSIGLIGWRLQVRPITGDGYSFAPDSGALTISSNAGTKNWRNNAGIRKNQVLSLILQDSVTEIGEYAFSGCTNLTDTGLGSNTSVKSIGISSFAGCRSLQETGLGSNRTITTIGEYAFQGAASLKSTGLESNSTVRSLGAGVFMYCSGLQSTGFEGNSTIKSIGANAFNSCTGLQSTGLESNSTVLGIGMYAFMHCDNLRSTGLEHNSTVLGIGEYAFYYCTNLEDTGLASNSSVLQIKDYAFGHCEKLKSFVIRGDSIPVFGKDVFSNVADDFAVYYPVMVTNGSIREVSNGKRMENSVTNGASVTIRSDDAPAGMEFQEWTVDHGNIVLTPANSETATFTMIEDAVKVSATYKELTYALSIQTEDGGTVTGTASGQYAAGTPITLKAIPNSNYKFDGWTATGIDLTNEQKNNAELSFAMPAENVKLTATFEREPDPHIHTFDSDWKFDAEYHWHECTAGDGARSDEAAHTASDWIIDQPATETEAGSRHKECTVCGYAVETEVIPPLGHTHTWENAWSYDTENHWHECKAGDGARSEEAAHSFGDWNIIKQPSTSAKGAQERTCTVCGYQETAELPGPEYSYRTLTDPATGVKVSGYFTADAALEVKEMLLHVKGDCQVCDDIRTRQDKGELIVFYDISLGSGSYQGDLEVTIPVGETYNGQSVFVLHCKDKVLESRTLTVENGAVTGTFSGLSPYAVAKTESETVITGLPDADTLLVGGSVSWTPAPAGGAWSYDKDYLEMTQSGGTYTFKALKAGKATATYTVDGVPFTVSITINPSTTPQTGDTSNPLPFLLLAMAALAGCCGLVVYGKRSKRA